MFTKIKLKLVFLLLTTSLLSINAQEDLMSFDQLTIMDGLSQSSVYCILQDKEGFMWFGTRDGLNKFDGYSFKAYKNIPENCFSISNNEIISLSQDKSGLLWIGTRGGGLNIFDPSTEKFLRFQNNKKTGCLKSDVVTSIFRDTNDEMWIGTTNGMYKAIKEQSNDSVINLSFIELSKEINVINYQNFAVRNINSSIKGNLLVSTENGFYLFNPATYKFKPLNLPGNANTCMYTSSYQQSESILWLGAFDYGLFKVVFEKDENSKIITFTRFDINQKGFFHLEHNRVDALLPDNFNNLWVATRGGLVKINLKTNTKSTYSYNPLDDRSISDNKINSIFVDRTGVFWVGTESQGVNKYDLHKKKFYHYKSIPGNPNSISNNVVSAIYGDGDNAIWVGTDGGGIDKIDFANTNHPKFTHFKSYPSQYGNLISDNILSLYRDRKNTLWVGSSCNYIINLKKDRTSFDSDSLRGYIFAIMEDDLGNIWTGNWNVGLVCQDPRTFNYKVFRHIDTNPQSLSFNAVFSIYQDRDRNIWVGTKGGGLNKLVDPGQTPEEAKFKIYKNELNNPKSLSHNDIYCIYQDKSGILWIGTGGGLNKAIYFIKDNKPELTFTSYLEKDGLPNAVIYGIVEDKHGNLWLSTNKGISKFDPLKEKFENFDINDGLQANEFHQNAYYIDSKGIIYFGGINGLNFFNPDSINVNPFKPQVAITNLKIMGKSAEIGSKINGRMILNKSISQTDELVLTYREKEVTIEFAALHYAVPKKNKYKYRLKGFNDSWQEVSSQTRSVTYTNLDNGNYVFEVMASNNDEKWSDKPTQLKIKVLPPPWKTIWAYLFYISSIVLLLLILRKYSLIAVEEKNKLKIEHIEREKIEELTKLKIQFFTNVSHELRTPLTLISSPLEDLINYKKTDGYVSQQLDLIQRNVNRLLQMINQLLDFRKIDSGQLKLNVSEVNLIELLGDIYMSFSQHAKSRGISFHFKYNNENIKLWLDKEKITTVFYNILSNAFKFSPDNSSVIIEVLVLDRTNTLIDTIKKLVNVNYHKPVNLVEVNIKDTGFGINKQHINKIFDRFYQVKDAQNQKFEGSGIGLAIAREYVEMHGGKIGAESETGEGSIFKVVLPFGKKHLNNSKVEFGTQPETSKKITSLLQTAEETLESEEFNYESTTSDQDQQEMKKPVILIVDDNREMLEYLNIKFSVKYKILQANNGEKALLVAIEKNPDLIITDLMMPEMDGIELCKRIKTDINTSHIPIIILTAKTTEESAVEGLETGADVFLSKPFNVDVLKAQIKTLLESREKMKMNFARELILQPKNVTVTSTDERFLKKLMDVVEQNISDVNFGIKELTLSMGMSHSVIFRKTKSLTGLNVVEFIRSIRLKKAALILKNNKLPIAEVSYMVGFSDPKYFSKCFIKEFGVTPSEHASRSIENDNALETNNNITN